ncbi:PREDICTED: uncharacterized protein LOC105569791, partial [Vollenhovia emeryi]|uniref:uncharacterized protein LOC105569791 n=1 Tax=Vollenhovia emeryi TaxID=411798 RepID=UPI0005F4A885
MINDVNTESRGMVRITMQSMHGNYRRDLTCLVIPVIADLIPSEVFPRETIKLPSNVRLADPSFHLPRAVDLLIGSGLTLSLFSVGQINLSREDHDLYLQKTRLGWVVVGGVPSQVSSKPTCCMTNLENQLNKFWAIEEVREGKMKSDEQIDCEAHFEGTVSRDADGHHKVRLPFRKSNTRLGESRSIALRRLLSLERKLSSNAALRKEYARVIEKYLTLNHTLAIEGPDDDGYYLPHHAVIKEASNTTKVRMVFDASAKTNSGMSLSDVLMVGPTIQDTLFSHLIRFRTYNYVITADIEKMYRQVLLHEDDRRYQRFLRRVDGLLGPIILYAKGLMQDIWRSGLQWDESVPQDIYTEWKEFVRQLESINRFTFERKLLINDYHDVQIHGFCDASSVGYGACLYVRSSRENETTIVRLACAKSRVAPLKPITIPRLELCGALILAQLYREASAIFNVTPNRVIF